MMKKKMKKNSASVKTDEKKPISTTPRKRGGHGLIGLLGLFAGFALYTIGSFFGSTGDFIDNMKVSVLGEGEEAVQEVPKLFADVPFDHPRATQIEALFHAGIINGYDDGSFRPDNTINRAELLTVLSTAVDADFGGKKLDNCFADVADQWFSPFVCFAKDAEWVRGFEDGTYKPDKPVTKAEVLKIVFEAFNYELCGQEVESVHNDVQQADWFFPYACAAKNTGVISNSKIFSPAYQITRGDFVQIIYATMMNLGLL